VHIADPLISSRGTAAKPPRDLPPGEHPPRLGRQHGQHPELRRGQLDGSPAETRRLPGQVQVQTTDLPDRVRLPVQAPTPQDRPDPADHLSHREWLAQVIKLLHYNYSQRTSRLGIDAS
jgi:hypothetical protein